MRDFHFLTANIKLQWLLMLLYA